MTSGLPRRPLLVIVAVICLALGALGYGVISGWLRAGEEKARADSAAVAAEQLCDQVERQGGLCVVDPADLQGEAGPVGPQGEPGRGVDAVRCTSGTWTVLYSDGTADMNAGPCTGAAGPSGEDGEDGTDGEPGPTGPTGPTGPPGTSGQDGTDGRSITNATCNPDTGLWEITYSDGSTDYDAGPCYDPGPL